MSTRPLRVELESAAADCGPAPAIEFVATPKLPAGAGVRVGIDGLEYIFAGPDDHSPHRTTIGDWSDIGAGWRLRVAFADPPVITNRVTWTAPELNITTVEDGRERSFVVAAPLEEGAEVVIGRDPAACGVVVNDGHVSRRHLRLFQHKGRLLAEDLRSRWGTTLNARPLAAPSELSHGDVLVIGVTTLRFVHYWDVLTRPTRPDPGAESRAVRATTASPVAAAPPPPKRPVPLPPMLPAPPSVWEQNAKMVALGVFVLCCLGLGIAIIAWFF